MQDRHVLRPIHRIDAFAQVFRRIAPIVIFAPQQWHVQIRQALAKHLMTGRYRTFFVSLGKTVDEALARTIGMAVEYENSPWLAHD